MCKKLTQKHSEHSETLRTSNHFFGEYRSVRSVFESTFCKMWRKVSTASNYYLVVRGTIVRRAWKYSYLSKEL